MKMNKEYFANELIKIFPEHEEEYRLHIEDYGEFLGHIFFGMVITNPLSHLLLNNKNTKMIKKYIDFIENMWANGDDDVQNIVEVSILENFGDNEIVLKNVYTYLSEELIQASKSLEEGLGRRKIYIFYRKGKVYADW